MNKIGINSNVLKIIAFFAIIFDHIGVYFASKLDVNVFLTFRIIGRVAMPIFAYLVVQGFFHTKNLSKYVRRMFLFGVITHLILLLMYTINNNIFLNYKAPGAVLEINILITFAISLIILKAIDNIVEKRMSKISINKSDIILAVFSCLLFSLYFITTFDYSFFVVIYIILMYVIEKISKVKKIEKPIYIMLHFIALFVFIMMYRTTVEYFSIFAIVFIALYNGERGKNNKLIQTLFYAFYPLQHLVIYLIAMLSA